MKKALMILGIIAALCFISAFASAAPVELTWAGQKYFGTNIGDTDLGKVKVDGDKLLISGSGADVWGTADAFYYVYREVTGDFEATLKVSQVSDADPWAKLGIMARTGLEAGATHAFVCATNENNLAYQRRVEVDSDSLHNAGEAYENGTIVYLKLVRKGDVLTAFTSPDGKAWTEIVADDEVKLVSGKILLGVAHTSHNAEEVGVDGVATEFVVK